MDLKYIAQDILDNYDEKYPILMVDSRGKQWDTHIDYNELYWDLKGLSYNVRLRLEEHNNEYFDEGYIANGEVLRLIHREKNDFYQFVVGQDAECEKEQEKSQGICICPTDRFWIMNNGCKCGRA